MKQIKSMILVLMLASGHVFAASEQIPQDRKITRISVYENDVIVIFTPNFINSQGCIEAATNQLVIDMDNNLGKTLYTAALSAAATGGHVGFGINGCKNSPKIYRIDMKY